MYVCGRVCVSGEGYVWMREYAPARNDEGDWFEEELSLLQHYCSSFSRTTLLVCVSRAVPSRSKQTTAGA